jgi:DNA polymerase III delta prime subunit
MSFSSDPTARHFAQLANWLEMESLAETQRLAERRERANPSDLEATGETLLDLVIVDHQIAVGGLYLLNLVKRNRNLELPWNRLRVGSPVVMSATDLDGEPMLGVVSLRSNSVIQVALDEWPDGERFRLDLSPDERTRKRQQAALIAVQQARGRLGELRNVFMGLRPPRFGKPVTVEPAAHLNASQQEAVRFALTAEDVAIIHGPPGTGKTTTVIELIRQLVQRGNQVLACAPSNTAVDNLLERSVEAGLHAVRLGHPARVAESLREHSLDALVQNHPDMRIVSDLMRQAEQVFRRAARYTRARQTRSSRQEMRHEARQLKADARRLERQVVQHIVDRADVICATTALDDDLLGDRIFPWLVIDEACQSTEPGCWIPLLRSERVVLAGDHCQLPPTIVSKQAAKEGFAKSLLERTIEQYGPDVTRRLDVQYRMHEQIMRFSSDQFYDGTLHADDQVREHRLSDLPHVHAEGILNEPVTFIDTAGAGWEEEQEPDGESRLNVEEGRLVLRKVEELLAAGVAVGEIAVIAPYAAQVRWLRNHAPVRGIEIDTVDGFQGREKEAVVISLVRSNTTGEIGFLGDTRRMNVALTRARRKLLVIGDSATLGGHLFYQAMIEYMESIGAYHSVWEES